MSTLVKDDDAPISAYELESRETKFIGGSCTESPVTSVSGGLSGRTGRGMSKGDGLWKGVLVRRDIAEAQICFTTSP